MTGALHRILVIEDDAKTAAQIVGFLTTRGYEAHTRSGVLCSCSSLRRLRSTTFKLALISIGVFGAVVISLFGYVYWSATTFAMSRSDSAIEAKRAILRNVYDSGGRDGLIRAIEQQGAEARFEGGLYLLADKSFAPVTGNLEEWPSSLKERKDGLSSILRR